METVIIRQAKKLEDLAVQLFAELEFPTITICGSGQYLGIVKRVLYNKWKKEQKNFNITTLSEEETSASFREFLERVYNVKNGTNLIDILSTMISAELDATDARNLIRHEQNCQKFYQSRKKREIVRSCPDDWKLNRSKCFRFFSTKNSWDDARSTCKNIATGADLAIAPDADTVSVISALGKPAKKKVLKKGHWPK